MKKHLLIILISISISTFSQKKINNQNKIISKMNTVTFDNEMRKLTDKYFDEDNQENSNLNKLISIARDIEKLALKMPKNDQGFYKAADYYTRLGLFVDSSRNWEKLILFKNTNYDDLNVYYLNLAESYVLSNQYLKCIEVENNFNKINDIKKKDSDRLAFEFLKLLASFSLNKNINEQKEEFLMNLKTTIFPRNWNFSYMKDSIEKIDFPENQKLFFFEIIKEIENIRGY